MRIHIRCIQSSCFTGCADCGDPVAGTGVANSGANVAELANVTDSAEVADLGRFRQFRRFCEFGRIRQQLAIFCKVREIAAMGPATTVRTTYACCPERDAWLRIRTLKHFLRASKLAAVRHVFRLRYLVVAFLKLC